MTTPKDTIQEALARNKTLAARLLVHAQDLAAQVAASETSLAQAQAGGAADLVAALQKRLDEQRGPLEDAQREYTAVVQELDALKRLLKDADRASVVADLGVTLPGDGLSASAVDQALARVREHAAALDAQVSLNRELSAARAPATPVAPQETPEEKARRQLDELKAARDKRNA
jgi:hypothetical protein